MPLTLPQLKNKYFLTGADLPVGSRIPLDDDGSVATLIDGLDYFKEVYNAILDLKGKPVQVSGKTFRDFVYIANWNFQADLNLPDPKAPKTDLFSMLAIKAQDGVDVRILLWFAALAFPESFSQVLRWLYDTPSERLQLPGLGVFARRPEVAVNWLSSMKMRKAIALKNKVLLDYGAHPLGAHHMKVACIYNASTNQLVSFCGGMDFVENRWGEYAHNTDSPLIPPGIPPGMFPIPVLSNGGAGALPQGDYEVRYSIVAESGGKKLTFLSENATITLPPGRKIAISGLSLAPPPLTTLQRVIYARRVGWHDVARATQTITDPAISSTEITDLTAISGPELTLWQWHDVALKVEGQGAATIADFIRLRWNDVLNYDPLPVLNPLTTTSVSIGSVNPMGKPDELVAPAVAASSGGVLPGGEYEVFYTLNEEYGIIKLSHASKSTSFKLTGGSKLKVSGLITSSGIPVATTKDRSIWIIRKGQAGDLPMLAARITDPAITSFEINTSPGAWTEKFPLDDYKPAPIDPTSQTVQSIAAPIGQQSMQVLLTVADIGLGFKVLFGTPRQYSFAPDGEFTVYYAYKKAIAAASKYIYIEDQAMASTQLMELIAQHMTGTGGVPNLIIILVTSGMVDPADKDMEGNIPIGWNEAIYEKLIQALPAASQGNVRLFRSRGLTIHSKLMIIDDEWAAVGSANALNRSFSTDTEMQVAVVDAAASALPKELRKKLWAEHLSILPGNPYFPVLDDIDNSLWMWNPGWGADPGLAAALPSPRRVAEVPLPVKDVVYPPVGSPSWLVLKMSDWATKDFL